MRLCVRKRGYKLAAGGGGIVDQRSSAGAYHVDRQADVLEVLCPLGGYEIQH
jgi:hypothetical protein